MADPKGKKLTQAQLKITEQMLVNGRVSLSKDSSEDYVKAAAFVFDNGLFFARNEALQMVREALEPKP